MVENYLHIIDKEEDYSNKNELFSKRETEVELISEEDGT